MQSRLERLKGHLWNAKLGISVRSLVDQQSMDLSLLGSIEVANRGLSLRRGCLNTVHIDNLHFLVERGDVEGLNAKHVAFDLIRFVGRLHNLQVGNVTGHIKTIIKTDLRAAWFLEPSVCPLLEVDLQSEIGGSDAQLGNEVLQLRIFEGVLLEVGLEALLEDILAQEEDHLMQECSTFSVTYSIENILRTTRVDNICGDRMRCVLLVLAEAPVLLVEEDVPGKGHVLHSFALVHGHV